MSGPGKSAPVIHICGWPGSGKRTIAEAENLRRLSTPERVGTGKLIDGAILRDLRARHEILRLPGAQEVEVTDLSAQAAAEAIAGLLGR